MNTHIVSLHVQEMGLFSRLDISFSPGVNIIIGPNGCGKTSILKLICYCLSVEDLKFIRIRKNAEFWIDAVMQQRKIRCGAAGIVETDQEYRQLSVKMWGNIPTDDVDDRYAPTKTIPYNLLAIGANRPVEYEHIGGMKKESKGVERQNLYRKTNIKSLENAKLPSVKQWMINRYFIIEKDWAEIKKNNWEKIMSILPKSSPYQAQLKFERIESDLEPIFSVNDKLCYFEELASGFKSFLSIIFSIADWCEGVNDGESGLLENAEGTVLIDEIDAHLHPEWQAKIIKTLTTIFPKLQFILTSHSPHIIASAEKYQVIAIPEHDGIVTLEPKDNDFRGWQLDFILEDLMGFSNEDELSADEVLVNIDKAYESGDIDSFDRELSKLSEILHRNDPVLKVYKIKRSNLL
ncbi:MAG: AAA family ATPase [Desulfobacteraceae bacterium]|nr:AAA family ATPase [Desulfobacteraceae bacterium]